MQIQPSGSFVGAGLWHPEAAPLALMRRAIDRKSEKLKNVLLEPSMRKEFLKGVAKDEKKVVKGFIDVNSSDMLKTKPKVMIFCTRTGEREKEISNIRGLLLGLSSRKPQHWSSAITEFHHWSEA